MDSKSSRSVRSWLAIAKASIGASALAIAMGGLPAAALAAGDHTTADDAGRVQERAPNLIFGGGVGYGRHYGRTTAVDAVTGASTSANKFHKDGVALNAFADVSAFEIGRRGDIGLAAGVTVALPSPFMNVAFGPRYRMYFPLADATVRSVEPWFGLGVALAFRDSIDENYYLWFPLSAGCDVQLGNKGLYAGIAVDANTINPKGVKHGSTDEDRMDNIVVLARLAYRVF